MSTVARWYGKEAALQLAVATAEGDMVQVDAIREAAIECICDTLRQFVRDITGRLHWVTENPGRQGALHTSSFNPLPGSPAELFGPQFSSPINIGVSDQVYVVLRALRRQHEGCKALPKPIWNRIIDEYMRLDAIVRFRRFTRDLF